MNQACDAHTGVTVSKGNSSIALVTIFVMTLVGCGGNDDLPPHNPHPTDQGSPEQLLRKIYKAMTEGDVPRVLECHTGSKEHKRALVAVVDYGQAAYRFVAKLEARFGPDAFEEYCRVEATPSFTPRLFPLGVDILDGVDIKADNGRAIATGPYLLNDFVMIEQDGVWRGSLEQISEPEKFSRLIRLDERVANEACKVVDDDRYKTIAEVKAKVGQYLQDETERELR